MYGTDWILPLVAAGLAALLLFWLRLRMDSVFVGVLSRWARWLFAGIAFGWALHTFAYPDYEPVLLGLVGLLFWFVLDTTYNYLAIKALSRSGLPLFPRFAESEGQDIWPNEPRFLRLRETIRRHRFERRKTLTATIAEGITLRLAVFSNKDRTVLLSVYLLPVARTRLSAFIALQSETTNGHRIVTDNISIPFGGFYPEKWSVERRPLTHNFETLLTRHLARVDARGERLAAIEDDPLERLNADQKTLEKLNRDLGFLAPREDAEDEGTISAAGRYRVWKEAWMLGYLARPLRY
ncbi:MAG: hypothetical protein JJU00_11850 [Opitutales bacterium]|nr:hypothetical protein [Opitutales bacterium]